MSDSIPFPASIGLVFTILPPSLWSRAGFGLGLGLEFTFLVSSISVVVRLLDEAAAPTELSTSLSTGTLEEEEEMASTCFQICSICVWLASFVCSMVSSRRLRDPPERLLP